MKVNCVQVLVERMEEALSEVRRRQDRVDEIEQELSALCPVDIGDIVRVDDDEPNAGKKMEVIHITFSSGSRFFRPGVSHHWMLTGPVLRKDLSKTIRYGKCIIEVER